MPLLSFVLIRVNSWAEPFCLSARRSPRLRGEPRDRRGGFTLAEMLVAVGIALVLVAILLPAVGRVRRQAQAVGCLANLRQLGFAYGVYAAGNDRRGPAFTFSKSDSWVEAFRVQAETPTGLYLCPRTGDNVSPDFGTAQSSWTLTLERKTGPARVSGSYGFNAWLMTWEPKGKGGQQFSGGKPGQYLPPAASGMDLVPVFADATWADGWPRADDPSPPDLVGGDRKRQGPEQAPKENMMARFAIARHGRGINVVFLDGHAGAVPLDDLKRLKWHKDFAYRDWNPPLPPR